MTISSNAVRTTCAYCGVGCGIIATPQQDGEVRIEGDPAHPANKGQLCSKGRALGETLCREGRQLFPEINGVTRSWHDTTAYIASRLSQTIRDHGQDSIALYVSGQLLTEDYYVANKFMKGFIGTANIDTNSRLCMASSVAGHRRAFGADTVPGNYEDLDLADVAVLVGSNMAWCHPVLFQRLLAARDKRGTKIICIDPRRTVTATVADLHLPLRSDTDIPLFLGLLNYLEKSGNRNVAYAAAVEGVDDALCKAGAFTIDRVSALTGLDPVIIGQFYSLFCGTEKIVTVYSQGVNQSTTGTDKVNAIINCHLLTGRIGKPGMGPFSLTGQPNAMGGREVGGLSNMLAAHMDIEDEAARSRVQTFWNAPTIAKKPGLKAIDLFKGVADGRIKAIWIMGTNPVVSMPNADFVADALKRCPFVVVSDIVRMTDTTRYAHVLLPAAGWGEKDGTVTNSERRISRQRAFLPLPGAALPDWKIIADVARTMGFSGFEYESAAAIFAEHAALSGVENNSARDFDISRHAEISGAEYNDLAPFQWPMPAGADQPRERFFGDGKFYTATGRAHMVAVSCSETDFSHTQQTRLKLNTGRIRDQWHTMTRTGKSPRLMGQYGEPFCEIHPDDAKTRAIDDATLIEIGANGTTGLFRALMTDRQPRGSVFVPMHWTDQFASGSRVNAMTRASVDPWSGQPGLKQSFADVRSLPVRFYGFAVTAHVARPQQPVYWATARVDNGFSHEFALHHIPEDWAAFMQREFSVPRGCEWISVRDSHSGGVRFAAFNGARLAAAIFVSAGPVRLARRFLIQALAAQWQGAARYLLLAGHGGANIADDGAMVCACMNVGANSILKAFARGCKTVSSIAETTGAGAGCGSCRHEIGRLIDAQRNTKAS